MDGPDTNDQSGSEHRVKKRRLSREINSSIQNENDEDRRLLKSHIEQQ